MKVQVQSKKGLKTTLSIIIDKAEIKKKLDTRLMELQKQIDLKGFRKGKVPPLVIKNQFGKAIYGEVIDKVLKESTSKAIQEKKLKIASQPKIDLKTFGEGKDLSFELQLDLLPEIKIQSFEKYKVTDYSVKISKEVLDERLINLSKEYKSFKDKKADTKSQTGDQVVFNINKGGLENAGDASASGEMYVFNPSSTTFTTHFMSRANSLSEYPGSTDNFVAGYVNSTNAVTGVRFHALTSNTISGTFLLYGLKDS